jgi:hydroxymethylpyrimidine/phosphomethylpyrimidine kinase
MVAKSGDKLLHDEAIDAMRSDLLPLATVLTPNIPEAIVLANHTIENRADMLTVGHQLLTYGPRAVFMKGGHSEENESTDCLCLKNDNNELEITWFPFPRISTKNTHGTGCTLSSAIAAYLARGEQIPDAVRHAKVYVSEAIQSGADYSLGSGHGPVKHFYKYWID